MRRVYSMLKNIIACFIVNFALSCCRDVFINSTLPIAWKEVFNHVFITSSF